MSLGAKATSGSICCFLFQHVREAVKAIGQVDYTVAEKMQKSRQFSRSLYVIEDIKAGDVFAEKNFRSIRPGYGLHPKYYNEVQGKRVKMDLERGAALTLSNI